MPRNVSLFALPIYWIFVNLIRMYSVGYAKRQAAAFKPSTHEGESGVSSSSTPDDDKVFSNASPHGSSVATSLRKVLTPAALATYERAEAAHRNGMENLAPFFAAVILGNWVGLPALEVSLIAWLYVATRIAYTVFYIRITGEVTSYLRSVAFGVGALLCSWLMFRAAVFTLYDYQALH